MLITLLKGIHVRTNFQVLLFQISYDLSPHYFGKLTDIHANMSLKARGNKLPRHYVQNRWLPHLRWIIDIVYTSFRDDVNYVIGGVVLFQWRLVLFSGNNDDCVLSSCECLRSSFFVRQLKLNVHNLCSHYKIEIDTYERNKYRQLRWYDEHLSDSMNGIVMTHISVDRDLL